MNQNLTTSEFIKHASAVAENYGFLPMHRIINTAVHKECRTSMPNTATARDQKCDSLDGLLADGVSLYCKNGLHAFEQTPILTYVFNSVPQTGELAIGFHIYNVSKSISEILLIQMLKTLVQELGFTEYTVRLNSLGDQESLNRYQRELTQFFRKRIEYLPASVREALKQNPLEAMIQLNKTGDELIHKAPSPLEFLSDVSRKHFREVVEFLDMSDTPYEIDPRLIGHHECYSDTLFAIDLPESGQQHDITINGGRYNTFIHTHTGVETFAAGAVLTIKKHKLPKRIPRAKTQTPKVYAVQLGFGPKLRTLMLINELRKANIPTSQSVVCDSLSQQLREAEKQKIRYAIIIGQKEYVEGTVILRDMQARNQETIPQDKLLSRLKRRKAIIET